MCIKFECEEISITGDNCGKSDSKEGKVGSFAFREDEAIRKAIDCQQGEAKRSYRGFVTVVINIIIIVLLFFIKVMFWRLCIFSKFCKGVY